MADERTINSISTYRLVVPKDEILESWHADKPRLHKGLPLKKVLHANTSDIPLLSERGVVTPQGWLLSKVLRDRNDLLGMPQSVADTLTARALDVPKSWAVLFRLMTNVTPGSITRKEALELFVARPERHFAEATQPLLNLATKVDAFQRDDWERVQEQLAEKHRQGASRNKLDDLVSAPDDLTQMVGQAFITGADYSTISAFQGVRTLAEIRRIDREFARYDGFVGIDLAAVETLHASDLRRCGHDFFYSGLFGFTNQEVMTGNREFMTTVTPQEPEAPEGKTTLVAYQPAGPIVNNSLPDALATLARTNAEKRAIQSRPPAPASPVEQPALEHKVVVCTPEPPTKKDQKFNRSGLFKKGARLATSGGLYLGGVFSLFKAWGNFELIRKLDALVEPRRPEVQSLDKQILDQERIGIQLYNELKVTADRARRGELSKSIEDSNVRYANLVLDKSVVQNQAKPLEKEGQAIANWMGLEAATGVGLVLRHPLRQLIWNVLNKN